MEKLVEKAKGSGAFCPIRISKAFRRIDNDDGVINEFGRLLMDIDVRISEDERLQCLESMGCKDGFLSLKKLLDSLFCPVPDGILQDIQKVFDLLNIGGKEKICVDDLVKNREIDGIVEINGRKMEKNLFKKEFRRMFDHDRDGFVSLMDLAYYYVGLTRRYDEKEVRRLIISSWGEK